MKKGQVLQGTVAYVDFPNKGVVKVEEGKQVIVKNVLPGQEISFSVNKVRKGKGEGRLLEVLKKAPNELPEAPCPHFGICGGCTYQNLSYEDQLALKGQQVKKLMDAVVDPEWARQVCEQIITVAPNVIKEAVEAGSVKVISNPSLATEPVSPNIMKNTMLAAAVGFVLVIGIIVLQVLLDNKINTEEDVTKYLDMTVLGVIPQYDQGGKKE